MPELIFRTPSEPDYTVIIPDKTAEVTDVKAKELGYAGWQHLILRYLLDNLLVRFVLPSVEHSPEVKAELAQIAAEQTAKAAEFETKRLAPYLPTLSIGGKEITLPAIEASLKAAKEAAAAAKKVEEEAQKEPK
jgi:hypothetical protein